MGRMRMTFLDVLLWLVYTVIYAVISAVGSWSVREFLRWRRIRRRKPRLPHMNVVAPMPPCKPPRSARRIPPPPVGRLG